MAAALPGAAPALGGHPRAGAAGQLRAAVGACGPIWSYLALFGPMWSLFSPIQLHMAPVWPRMVSIQPHTAS